MFFFKSQLLQKNVPAINEMGNIVEEINLRIQEVLGTQF